MSETTKFFRPIFAPAVLSAALTAAAPDAVQAQASPGPDVRSETPERLKLSGPRFGFTVFTGEVAGGSTLPFGDIHVPLNLAVGIAEVGPRFTVLTDGSWARRTGSGQRRIRRSFFSFVTGRSK